ncbi:PAS domain-containing hybrid sensor histidine kinase/response regulator [Desulforegula conservatrix]|uniref:PAS domain-containing hybrid sensor histidine kinase/response regulator n=1 Tax=Desulforegula conservatrix TaxID=153026 RepID=UPI000688A019|nr:PAS domain S-box protein [Desulforegula conservatrix]
MKKWLLNRKIKKTFAIFMVFVLIGILLPFPIFSLVFAAEAYSSENISKFYSDHPGALGCFLVLTLALVFTLFLLTLYMRSRNRLIKAMSKSEARYRRIVEGTNDIPYSITSEGIISFIGPQIKKYGLEPDEMVGRFFIDFVYQDDRDDLMNAYIEARDGSKELDTILFRLADNRYAKGIVWFEIKGSGDLLAKAKNGNRDFFGIIRDVTSRKLTEDKLKDSEMRYQALLEAASDSILILKDDIIIDCNKKTEEAFCVSRNEVIGMSPVDFSPEYQPDGRRSDEKALELINSVLEDRPQIFEWAHLKGDISIFSTEVSLTRVFFKNAFYILAIIRDITERKIAEEKMARLATVVEQVSESVVLTDLDGVIKYVNPAFEKKTGYSMSESDGQKTNLLKSSIHDESFYREMWDIILDGGTWRGVMFNVKKGGGELIEDAVISPIRGSGGDIIGFVAVKRDVTEEYRLNEQLKISERQFRTIFDHTPYSITISRMRDQKYVAVNPAFINYTGFAYEDVIGHTSEDLGVNASDFNQSEFFDRLIKDGSVMNQQIRIIDHKGEEKYIIFSSAVMDFSGEPCFLSTSIDVTEAKMLEEKLRQSQKMDAIGQLAGGIAHDFNNMLSGIIGGAELLTMMLPSDSPLRKHAGIVLKSAEMAADLTEKLLAFSRKGKILKSDLDVHELLVSVIAILERSIDKNITIETAMDAQTSLVTGDAALLQSAFLNLGINARDAMKEGGTLVFSSSLTFLDESFCRTNNYSIQPGEYIEIDVRDTGAGIPKSLMQRIFEPFFTTKDPGKGTGLGLAAVYGTVKEHGGAIDVFSEEGIGTVFRIYLPLSVSVNGSAEPDAGSVISGSGLILIVEDEDIVRSTAKELLENLGYNVLVASCGEEALEIYAHNKADISLVFLDMVMPGINGRETFKKLKIINPEIKAVFTSGFAHEGALINLSETGVFGFIQKPYRISELGKTVALALSNEEASKSPVPVIQVQA